jgi:hypothetical protein
MDLAISTFKGLVNFEAAEQRVELALTNAIHGASLLEFLAAYAKWNAKFAGGVAGLTALISNQSEHFVEPSWPHEVADRANYVASFIFDAARDEFDDHINPSRDTHRCLAQAFLMETSIFLDQRAELETPAQAHPKRGSVMTGYLGSPTHSITGDIYSAFHGIGYHLGSEVLADREFSIIDKHLRAEWPELVKHLLRSTISLGGASHRCYAWIGIHSGEGGGVEADHAAYAAEAAHAAFKYLHGADKIKCEQALAAGFIAFAHDHAAFFNMYV